MLALDDTPAPSQPEGSGTFKMATWNIVDGRGGTIDASSRRLGADEGWLGGADGEETGQRQTPQNHLWVFYHVLKGGERAPRRGRAHVEGKQPKFEVESVLFNNGPNIVTFQLTTGDERLYVIGIYAPPIAEKG